MKTTITQILSVGLIAISLAACGSSTTAALPSTVNSGSGSAVVSNGLIGFTGLATNSGTQPQFTQTYLLAGPLNIPQDRIVGQFAQIGVGSTGNTVANGMAGQIQYVQKQSSGNGTMSNGQFTLFGSTNGFYQGSNMNFSGTIQLNPSIVQQIISTYGSNAQVTNLGLWVTQSVLSSGNSQYGNGQYGNQQYGNSQYGTSTYTGQIYSAVVFLYINGATQPFGPILF